MSRSGTQETPGEQNTPEHNQGNETGCKPKTSQKEHKYPNTKGSN